MSRLYDAFKETVLSAVLNGQTVRVMYVTSGYVPNFGADDFLNDISAGYRLSTSDPLTSMTFTAGAFDADNPTMPGWTGTAVAAVYYIDTGVEGTSRLIGYYDGSPFPIAGDGASHPIAWSGSEAAIFKVFG